MEESKQNENVEEKKEEPKVEEAPPEEAPPALEVKVSETLGFKEKAN